MELATSFRAKNHGKVRTTSGMNVRLDSDSQLVIELPESWVLRVVSRSVFLAAVILTLPFIGSILNGPSRSYLNGLDSGVRSELMTSFELIDVLLEDLSQEGLMEKVDKALVVSAGVKDAVEDLRFWSGNELHLAEESHVMNLSLIPDETYDFAYVLSSLDAKFVDRVMKVGGIVALHLTTDLWNDFLEQSNYKIVYLRKLEPTVVAMRKLHPLNLKARIISSATRRLCTMVLEARKAALRGLEDVLLEPPRQALVRSGEYLNRIKYLPELLGDSLQGYSRRVFVTVGSTNVNGEILDWFYDNYPTRNLQFENLAIASGDAASPVNLSNWLMNNVKEEEYVVMKAEAEEVEDLLKTRVIYLVDELFLECNNQWGYGENRGKRAYWECLSLYGRLRDKGVAVHQWWG